MTTVLLADPRPPFEDVYGEYQPKIRRWARRQHVWQTGYDDVVSEMLVTLWQAWEFWDGEHPGALSNIFWIKWNWRMSDINRAARWCGRRDVEFFPLEFADDPAVEMDLSELGIPPHPELPKPVRARLSPEMMLLSRQLWFLIALGFNRRDLYAVLDVDEQHVHRIIRRWRRALEERSKPSPAAAPPMVF